MKKNLQYKDVGFYSEESSIIVKPC